MARAAEGGVARREPAKRELTTEGLSCFDCGTRWRLHVVKTPEGPVVLCDSCGDIG